MEINPAVNLHVQDAPVQYDFSRSAAEIGSLAASAGNTHVGMPGWIVRGLTVVNYHWEVEVSSLRFKAPAGGGWCTYPSQVDVTIGYIGAMTVYVQNEFPSGTCQHQAVLDHEHTHVRIHRESLIVHLPLFQQAAMNASLSRAYPVFTTDSESGSQYILQVIQAAVQAEDEDFQRDRSARHALLDSPQSLAATDAACRRW